MVRPIAGTRPRGATPEEDKAFEDDLMADEKERAEHLMLVDLGRNDIGRVSVAGSVHPTPGLFMYVERYSHVMHIVTEVEGEMKEGEDAYSALRATFPMGTVSGAPKIRAMEIIDELEPVRRGPYSGGCGYISFSGDMDTCIIIRTIVVKDNVAYLQAGAGIVYDSVPEREFDETVNKAKALFRAVEFAEKGLES
jgi:anthranilate synthase component 1